MTIFAAVGGVSTFERLAAQFYAGVATDPLLRPLYSDADLAPAQRRLALFLMQYFGGPPTYMQERGHPRLRMRHVAFPITPAARDAWVGHMMAALDALDLPADAHATMTRYVAQTATFLINQAEV